MTTTEIIILVAALALIILVVFAAFLAVAAIRTLRNVDQVLGSLQKQLDDLDGSPRTFLNQANELSVNLNHKMRCLDPIFNSISNVGNGLQAETSNERDKTLLRYLNEKKQESNLETISDGIELALRGINLWQKFKKRS